MLFVPCDRNPSLVGRKTARQWRFIGDSFREGALNPVIFGISRLDSTFDIVNAGYERDFAELAEPISRSDGVSGQRNFWVVS